MCSIFPEIHWECNTNQTIGVLQKGAVHLSQCNEYGLPDFTRKSLSLKCPCTSSTAKNIITRPKIDCVEYQTAFVREKDFKFPSVHLKHLNWCLFDV